MITIESTLHLERVTGLSITEFLLNCTDERYQQWWPGTHRRFHVRTQGREHLGDTVFMEEYIGNRHVRMAGTVVDVVPGRRIVWQLKRVVRLPVWLTLELTDRDGAVAIRHTIRAGYTGVGRLLDPLLRLYFTAEFTRAMDDHVHTEFPLLRDRILDPGPATAAAPSGGRGERVLPDPAELFPARRAAAVRVGRRSGSRLPG
ncbi:MAG TPA: hypothetical protein VFV67_30175 [Actinophytocola sp.]|uniref:hypothetical protein n=1 Tax=Actinophytocola sp. TaxID=1872138 RepID=UPI002DBFE933|nr:hypothetical protein [Actinophytocola sp.]HEU5474931.1 hypothetical protein [Actinophytocola sp.]